MKEYWRGRLSKDADKCYSILLRGFKRQSSEVDCGNASIESIKNAYLAIYEDHPELFYLSNAPQIAQKQSGFLGVGMLSCSSSVIINPIYTAKEIRNCESEIKLVKENIGKKINSHTTDYEKVIVVAEYIVQNTTYEINNRFNQNAASALCYGHAQCSGITKAFKLLMDELGVYCICISGEATDEKGNYRQHAWNIVQIEGTYYHVDVTFMLGANTAKSLPLNKMYLFYDDNLCSQNHRWNRSEVPACTDGCRAINDFSKKTMSRSGTSISNAGQHSLNYEHYTSLNQLKAAMTSMIDKRISTYDFYLDIGLKTQSELCSTIRNAFNMVATRRQIQCSFTVSVTADLLVNINIKY